jgi:hypothetical protein
MRIKYDTLKKGHVMPNQNESSRTFTSSADVGLSPTPTDGLSEESVSSVSADSTTGTIYDPNALAMDSNADIARQRQATGQLPQTSDTEILESPESPAFEEGT